MRRLGRTEFDRLLSALTEAGYDLVGPVMRDDAIVYERIVGAQDLPEGWTDAQEAGQYRVHRRDDQALFGYVVGPHSWKRFLFPPNQTVFSARRTDDGFVLEAEPVEGVRRALIGVRACELEAIRVQDRVFLDGPYVDAGYQRRRASVFVVAVNCGQAGGTCFCASMESGPKAHSGYDLALTEVLGAGEHYFTVEAGSDAGQALLDGLALPEASAAECAAAAAAVTRAESQMGRSLDTNGLKAVLEGVLDSRHWEAVGQRCLSCANCTLVCPTCFCSTVEDITELDGGARRERRWDSCFDGEFSYVAGGSIRQSTASRYRQWLTHKLSSWHDQFGSSGCVGCGRCITWCPVGIDITQEAAALRVAEAAEHNG